MPMRGAVIASVCKSQENFAQNADSSTVLMNLLCDLCRVTGSEDAFLASEQRPDFWSVELCTSSIGWDVGQHDLTPAKGWVLLPLPEWPSTWLGLLRPSVDDQQLLSRDLAEALTWMKVIVLFLREKRAHHQLTEQVLNHEEDVLGLLLDGTGEGMWVYDVPSKKRRFSDSWLARLGWSPKEYEDGKVPGNLLHPEDLGRVMQHAADHMEGKTSKFECEYRLMRKDGSFAHVLGRGRVVKWDDDGLPLRMLGTSLDLTPYKKMQQDLLEAQKNMIESAKFSALGVMAAGIAHEINNPLAIIQAYSDMLENFSHLDEMKTRKARQAISRSVDRISKIIRGLRKVARDAEGDPFEIINLKAILDETMSFSQERILHLGIDLKIECDENVQLHVQPVQISQVMLNLLNNSVDALEGQSDSWISINAQQEGEKIVIRFMDSGPGVPESIRSQIFQPFFTTKQIGKGTGLGLSISRSIVHDHGGKFYLSEDFSVTCFVIELPLAAASSAQTA